MMRSPSNNANYTWNIKITGKVALSAIAPLACWIIDKAVIQSCL